MKIARPTEDIIQHAVQTSRNHSNSHLVMVARVLMENCTDPQSDTIELSPYLFQQHVAPEQ